MTLQTQNDFEVFFLQSLDLMCIASPQGYFVELNPAWERTLGHALDDLKAAPFIDFVHPDDREATTAAFEGLLSGEPVTFFENRYRRKDGGWCWLQWTSATRMDAGRIWAMAHDVTSGKAAERELRDTHSQLEARVGERTEQLAAANQTLQREVAERSRAEQLLRLVFETAQVVSSHGDLESSVRATLKTIGQELGWECGELWVQDRPKRLLVRFAMWRLGTQDLGTYEASTRHAEIPIGSSLAGQVWSDLEPLWIGDVQHAPGFRLRAAAVAAGLRSAFMFPWKVAGRVVGVAAFYSRGTREPDAALLRILTTVGQQLGPYFERSRTAQDREQEIARLELLNRMTRSVVERQDPRSILTFLLAETEASLGFDVAAICVNPGTLEGEQLLLGPASRQWVREAGSTDERVLAVCNGDARKPVFLRPTDACARELGLGAAAILPLQAERQPWGRLLVGRRHEGFGPAERKFIRVLAEHASLVFCHVRLQKNLKDAYEELRDSQKSVLQQERLRALGQMACGVAHDINNSLAPIVGYADMLLMRWTDMPGDAREYVEIIRTAGEDIAQVVARLRDLYRPREDGEPLTPVSLKRVVGQVVDLTRPRWRDLPLRHGVVIHVQVDVPADTPTIFGVESEIREAVTNLVLNCVDAMPDGGEIRVGAETVGDQVILEVGDEGAGMDEETLNRCLEPFFTTKGEQGTGLGLAMVFGIMERHGGEVRIESAPGRGTRIRLVFQVASSVEGPAVGPLPDPVAPRRLLVIDDEPAIRRLLSEMLGRDGHAVTVADGGPSGLLALSSALQARLPFDAVLTDMGMPHMNGLEVAQRVKAASPGTPVILLSGWGGMLGDGEVPSNLVDLLMAKPPRMFKLRAALASVLGDAAVRGPLTKR